MDAIQMHCEIEVVPARVFAAWTDSRIVTEWFSEGADIDLAERRFEIWGIHTPGSPPRNESAISLADVEENRQIRFHWNLRGARTLVEVKLAATATGTRVSLRHDAPGRPRFEPSIADFWSLSLENLRAFLEDNRPALRVDYSQPPRGDVSLDVEIEGSPEDVFEALVAPSALDRYIAQKATVEPAEGGRYDFGWGMGPVKILEIIPPQKLSYSWDDEDSVVTWSLAGSGGKTRLTLVHSGFSPDETREDYRTGWLRFLAYLRGLVEKGSSWRAIAIENPDHAECV